MARTKSDQSPPNQPPRVALAFADDDAVELGERIMRLTLKQAVRLSRYLEQQHGFVAPV